MENKMLYYDLVLNIREVNRSWVYYSHTQAKCDIWFKECYQGSEKQEGFGQVARIGVTGEGNWRGCPRKMDFVNCPVGLSTWPNPS